MRYKAGAAILLFLLVLVFPAAAQMYKPFTSFRVIKTEHFDIIFPKESEPSARLLASYADRTYDNISALLGIEVPNRIPVTFAPHTDMFNGYMNLITRPHIVLYDTPMDLEWTNFYNNLESLFIHELTHAVSLSSRNSVYKGFYRVFGGWASPTLINAPLFMVEGVTVSTESLTGFGRANDPLIKQKLRQALYEKKFPTPFQVSGVNDTPGQEGNYYEYGGLFSAWLRQTYGQEKYAELWQAIGGNGSFSFSVYRSGYYRIFKKVYGMDFLDAWKSFGASLTLDNLEENPDEIFSKQRHFFSEKETFFNGIASYGGDVYALNNRERKIYVYNAQTKAVQTHGIDSVASYDLDASARGLLVSSYSLVGERYFAVVTEYNAATLRKTGRKIRGLYKARYFRDGVIGIRSELHNTCISYEDFSGKKELLFRGNEELIFSGPQAVDNERMVFIAARKGARELWLYNYVTKELFRFETSSRDDAGSNYWAYMRGMGVSEGRLYFSHAADDRMYKLACIDLEKMEAVWSRRDFSGGVFNPVSVDGSVYYRGAFVSRDGLLLFPETADALSGTRSSLRLMGLDKEDNGIVSNGVIAVKSPETNNPEADASSDPWQIKNYHSIQYMNPFQFWFPFPLIGFRNDNFSFDGAGLVSVMIDPTDRNIVIALAYADIAFRMARVDTFLWQNTSLGFPLTLQFSDTVNNIEEDDRDLLYRDTRVSLTASQTWSMGQWFHTFLLGGAYAGIAKDNGADSAYQWKTDENVFTYSTGYTFTNRQRYPHQIFGTGFYFGAKISSLIDDFKPRVEGLIQASAETRFPVRFSLYGAYDELGMNLHGVSKWYGELPYANLASVEYYAVPNLTWLAGAEASLGLFSVEIQRNLSHAYFTRFYGALSLKNVLYDSAGHPLAEGMPLGNLHLAQSVMLKAALVSGFIPLKMQPFYIEPNAGIAWNFSNTITGKGAFFFAFIGAELRL